MENFIIMKAPQKVEKKNKADKQQKIIDDEVKSRQEKCKENRFFLAWIQANKLSKKFQRIWMITQINSGSLYKYGIIDSYGNELIDVKN